MKKAEQKELARELFASTKKSQKEIAALVGVTEKTLGAWKAEGHWEASKKARAATPDKAIAKILEVLYSRLEADDIKADEIAKLVASIEKLRPDKKSIVGFVNCFEEFLAYMVPIDTTLAQKFTIHTEAFLAAKIVADA